MIPIVWKQFTCTTSGSIFKVVVCENCKARYVYQMIREAQAQGTSLYMLDNDGARNRAQSSAEAELKSRLTMDCDPVPCVHCGWYQENMVRRLRKERYRWLHYFGVGTLIVGFLLAFGAWLIYCMAYHPDRTLMIALLSGVAACASIGGGAIMARSTLAGIWDPNELPQEERLRAAKARALTLAEFDDWLREQGLDPGNLGMLG